MFALCCGGTARHADDTVDLEFRCKTNGIAQRAIMHVTDGGIRMQRIAPHVQRGDVQTACVDLADEMSDARCGVRQQARHVAMIGRCVGAGADLQAGDFRHVANEPIHDRCKSCRISASVTKPIAGETSVMAQVHCAVLSRDDRPDVHQDAPVLDVHREYAQPMLGIVQGTTGAQIEFPTMPGAG